MAIPPNHLEGSESPETAGGDRATYWRQFYDHLVTFEESILNEMMELSRDMSEEQRRVVEETNILPLSSLIDDFKRRRDLWERGGAAPSDSAG